MAAACSIGSGPNFSKNNFIPLAGVPIVFLNSSYRTKSSSFPGGRPNSRMAVKKASNSSLWASYGSTLGFLPGRWVKFAAQTGPIDNSFGSSGKKCLLVFRRSEYIKNTRAT